jgi:hypothetical protein
LGGKTFGLVHRAQNAGHFIPHGGGKPCSYLQQSFTLRGDKLEPATLYPRRAWKQFEVQFENNKLKRKQDKSEQDKIGARQIGPNSGFGHKRKPTCSRVVNFLSWSNPSGEAGVQDNLTRRH